MKQKEKDHLLLQKLKKATGKKKQQTKERHILLPQWDKKSIDYRKEAMCQRPSALLSREI